MLYIGLNGHQKFFGDFYRFDFLEKEARDCVRLLSMWKFLLRKYHDGKYLRTVVMGLLKYRYFTMNESHTAHLVILTIRTATSEEVRTG